MFTKDFLQSEIEYFIKDEIKDELFGKEVDMILPSSRASSQKKSWRIKALVTKLSQEDASRLSVDTNLFRTLDIYLSDIDDLKEANPTAYIIKKNFQSLAQFRIEGSVYKVREEMPDQQFELSVRLICERVT